MKKRVIMIPHPDKVTRGAYVFGEAVPVNIFINGKRIEAPKAGIKVGRPMYPDIDHGVAVALGNFIDDKKK